MSVKLWLTLGASLSLLAACATHQENPNYAYSTKYKAGAPTTTYASAPTSYVQSSPTSYQSGATTTYASSASSIPSSGEYSRIDHGCLRKEKNHELIGAGLGGSLGAFAGNELIGGTKGTVIGAGLGGAVGYGIGDKTVNCDQQTFVMQSSEPAASPVYQPQAAQSPIVTHQSQTVQSQTVPATHQYASADQSRVVYQSPRVEYQAPTDTQFSNISDNGTPGYQVLQSQTVVQSVSAQPGSAYPVPVSPVHVERMAQASPASISGAQPIDYDYSENVVSASAFATPEYSETRLIGGAGTTHVVREGDTVYSLARKSCVGVNDIKSLNNLDYSFSIKIGDSLNLPNSKC